MALKQLHSFTLWMVCNVLSADVAAVASTVDLPFASKPRFRIGSFGQCTRWNFLYLLCCWNDQIPILPSLIAMDNTGLASRTKRSRYHTKWMQGPSSFMETNPVWSSNSDSNKCIQLLCWSVGLYSTKQLEMCNIRDVAFQWCHFMLWLVLPVCSSIQILMLVVACSLCLHCLDTRPLTSVHLNM